MPKVKRTNSTAAKTSNWYYLLPLMFILSILPLIVYLRVVPLKGPAFDFWNGQKDNVDFFSYYKMVWLLISSCLALGLFGLKVLLDGVDSLKKTYLYIPIAIYMFFVLLSTEFSKYQSISLLGFPDRYEGMYVLLAYMVLIVVSLNLTDNETHLKFLLGALFAGAIIIGLMGVFQYIGYDLFKSAFGKNLILPEAYKQFADKLQFQFSKHTIYATLYHTDYVGSYMAMLFPLVFSFFVLTKKPLLKVLLGLMALLMAVTWLGSNSRAGMVGGSIAMFVFLIMINKYIIKNWKYFLGGILILGLTVFGLNVISHGYLGSRISSLINDAKTITGATGKDQPPENLPLKDLMIKGNEGTVVTPTETLKFALTGDQITFEDKEDKPIPMKFDSATGRVDLQDNRFKEYKLTLGKMKDMNVLQLEKGVLKLIFKVNNAQVALLNSKGEVVNIGPVARWGFEGKELLGSSRGYIWSRSIPLLRDTIFVGHGPDTFAAYFPQNDFMGKLYAYAGDMWQLVDKPHDLYLQVGINTGIISLLALLSLFIIYFAKSVMLYIRNDYSDFISRAGVGIFVAICGYLGAAFFNDSVVSVAPVFWVLLGLGISANYMLEQKKRIRTGLTTGVPHQKTNIVDKSSTGGNKQQQSKKSKA
ncbi:MAG: O-antigen ligase family protein [Desulfitobacteriaceae bacterium]